MTEPPVDPVPGSEPGTGTRRPRRRDTAELPLARRRPPRPEGDRVPTEQLGAQPTQRLPIGAQPTERLAASPTEQLTAAPDPTPPARSQKRVAVLPIAIAAGGVIAAGVLALVIVGLAAAPGPIPVAAPSSTPTVVPETPAPPPEAAPAPAPAPVIVPPQREAGQNECVDSTGEGGVVDLSAVRLELDGNDLRATFELAQPLPTGDASVGIYAESKNGRTSYQFATVWTDGELDRFFAHDFAKDDDNGLDEDDVGVDGASIVAVIPQEYLKQLGDGWSWYAFSTAAGANVDACPGDILSFDSLTFETPGRGDNGDG